MPRARSDDRVPPSGELHRIQPLALSIRIVSATDVAWEGGSRPLARQPVQRPGERQGLGHRGIAGGEFVERRVRPGGCAGGESLRQGAIWGAGRGHRRARGEAVLAQRKVERVGPGMGVGEKAGGLEIGEAGDQRLPGAIEALLRYPALTPTALAAELRVAPQTATALLRELQGRRLVREVTGRGRFRAFAM